MRGKGKRGGVGEKIRKGIERERTERRIGLEDKWVKERGGEEG